MLSISYQLLFTPTGQHIPFRVTIHRNGPEQTVCKLQVNRKGSQTKNLNLTDVESEPSLPICHYHRAHLHLRLPHGNGVGRGSDAGVYE